MAEDQAGNGAAQPFATEAGAADPHLPSGPPPGPWRLLDRVVVLAFAVALVIPGILLAVHAKAADVENRAPRPFPALSLAGLADATWPAGFDGFLTDRLWPRPYAIRLRGEAYWLSGGTGNPDVIRGVDDWLFVREELQPRCLQSPAQQVAALQRAAAAFARRGIAFRFILVPDKHSVYPEKLPADDPFPPSCVDTNRPALDAAIASLAGIAMDATAALQAARAGPADIYYDGDTHWTPMGAAIAVQALAGSLGVWSADDLQVSGRQRRELDTSRLLGLRRVVRTPRLVIRPDVEQHRVDVPMPVGARNERTAFRITSTGRADLLPGRTLIVYDSFFGIDSSLVAPYFADSTWIHIADLRNQPELAGMLGSFDRVIVECVARGFYATDFDAILSPVYEPPTG